MGEGRPKRESRRVSRIHEFLPFKSCIYCCLLTCWVQLHVNIRWGKCVGEAVLKHRMGEGVLNHICLKMNRGGRQEGGGGGGGGGKPKLLENKRTLVGFKCKKSKINSCPMPIPAVKKETYSQEQNGSTEN